MNENEIVTITTKNYFDGVFYGLGWVLLVLSPPVLFAKWWLALILLLLGILLVTTRYQIKIDPNAQLIDDYLWILGIKTDRVVTTYSRVDFIYITTAKYSQQMNLKSISSTVQGTLFKAFLRSDRDNHYLGEAKDLNGVIDKVAKLAHVLKLEIKKPEL